MHYPAYLQPHIKGTVVRYTKDDDTKTMPTDPAVVVAVNDTGEIWISATRNFRHWRRNSFYRRTGQYQVSALDVTLYVFFSTLSELSWLRYDLTKALQSLKGFVGLKNHRKRPPNYKTRKADAKQEERKPITIGGKTYNSTMEARIHDNTGYLKLIKERAIKMENANESKAQPRPADRSIN